MMRLCCTFIFLCTSFTGGHGLLFDNINIHSPSIGNTNSSPSTSVSLQLLQKNLTDLENKFEVLQREITSDTQKQVELEKRLEFLKTQLRYTIISMNQIDTNIMSDFSNVTMEIGYLKITLEEILRNQTSIMENQRKLLINQMNTMNIQTHFGVQLSELQQNQTTLFAKLLKSITNVVLNITQHSLDECITSNNCWLEYAFHYDNSWNGCQNGSQFVRKTRYQSAPYLGVMTCSETRYKLFLSYNLTGKYYNIADGAGSGEDHCELVGSDHDGVISIDYISSPNTEGFYRSSRGQSFTFNNIGMTPHDTGKWYNKWYECSVNIPGNEKVFTV